MDRIDRKNFISDLADVINRHSVENMSNTPDFVIAEYLFDCLEAWNRGVKGRNDFHVRNPGVIDSFKPNSFK